MARPNKNYEPKREALAQTALDLFIAQGYESTTITQIMRAAGLTKAGMYHYFTSKEEILDAAIDFALAQDIEKTKEVLQGLSVEEKMLLFTRGNAVPSDLANKLLHVKRCEKDSYAAYRIRERLIHAYIPVMEAIIIEGVGEGVYNTLYPRQAAEFMVLLAKALVETNLLPSVSREDMVLRMRAFLQLSAVCLQPTPAHLEDITALFEEAILKMQEATVK